MVARAVVLAAALAASLPVPALGSSWGTAGGDAGRSGQQPLSRGTAPLQPLWHDLAPPAEVQGATVIAGQTAAYGTADGRLRLKDLMSGSERAAVLLRENGPSLDTFQGFSDGRIAPVHVPGDDGGPGQLYVVYNDDDQGDPTATDPDATFTDDVAIAQIDLASGTLVADRPVAGTDGQTISSSPVVTEPDAQGGRMLLFVTRGVDERAGTLHRVPLRFAGRKGAVIEHTDVAAASLGRITTLASPTLVHLRDESTDAAPRPPAPYVAVATADGGSPVQLFHAYDLAALSGPRLDRDAGDGHLFYASSVSVPVSASGRTLGTRESQVGRATALLVATWDSADDSTTVHRLVPDATGTTFVEAARSKALEGTAGPMLATSELGGGPGTPAGQVVLGTSQNLYVLKGGDLKLQWKLDPKDALKRNGDGFTYTPPTVVGDTVLAVRDAGGVVARRLADGSAVDLPLPAAFTGIGARGGVAAAAGVLLVPSAQGHVALRNACGNPLVGTGLNDTLDGTLAGDDLSLLGGRDVSALGAGDDCADGGADDDVLSGGDGADALLGGAGADRLAGGAGDDRADAGEGDDLLAGDAGNDTLSAGLGDDRADGGEGDDVLDLGAGSDAAKGGTGNDQLRGASGDDVLKGGDGDDLLRGGRGSDRLDGGDGNDELVSDRGGGRVSAGGGDDRVRAANGAQDTVLCGLGFDTVVADRTDRVAPSCESVRRVKVVTKRRAGR